MTSSRSKPPKPPSHLSAEAKRWYASVISSYALDPHHKLMLQAAAESWDRMQAARRVIQKEKLTFKDRFGQIRPWPEIGIEKDSKITFCRILRELRLDESEPDAPRPPRNPGRR